MTKFRAEMPNEFTADELRRFFAKITPTRHGKRSACWEWTGAIDGTGYGRFGVRRKNRYAHCVAWVIEHGPIPYGLELDHLCRNTICVRPSHMELVTHRENMLRGETTLPALMVSKTHCKRGHPFDAENTVIVNGWRQCRICNRIRHRRRTAA